MANRPDPLFILQYLQNEGKTPQEVQRNARLYDFLKQLWDRFRELENRLAALEAIVGEISPEIINEFSGITVNGIPGISEILLDGDNEEIDVTNIPIPPKITLVVGLIDLQMRFRKLLKDYFQTLERVPPGLETDLARALGEE